MRSITLAEYVRRRNGAPFGAPGSLRNMLHRSLGAKSFAKFWQYWNPIWGYVLGRHIYAPLRRILPATLALLLTFAISGGIHDLVIVLVRRSATLLFTPWFVLMAAVVLVGQALHIDYSKRSWASRALINLSQILGCLGIVLLARQIISF